MIARTFDPQSYAYRRGLADHEAGIEACPYRPGTDEALSYWYGWTYADSRECEHGRPVDAWCEDCGL